LELGGQGESLLPIVQEGQAIRKRGGDCSEKKKKRIYFLRERERGKVKRKKKKRKPIPQKEEKGVQCPHEPTARRRRRRLCTRKRGDRFFNFNLTSRELRKRVPKELRLACAKREEGSPPGRGGRKRADGIA